MALEVFIHNRDKTKSIKLTQEQVNVAVEITNQDLSGRSRVKLNTRVLNALEAKGIPPNFDCPSAITL